MEPRPHADDINNIMRLPGDHQTRPNLIVDRSRRRRGEGRKRNNSLSLFLSLCPRNWSQSKKKKKRKMNAGQLPTPVSSRQCSRQCYPTWIEYLIPLGNVSKRPRKLVRMFQLCWKSKGCFEKIKMAGVNREENTIFPSLKPTRLGWNRRRRIFVGEECS